MKAISDFLNNTTLNAGQQILIALIIALIIFFCAFFSKHIRRIFITPISEKLERNKRFKNKTYTMRDCKYLTDKSDSKKKLSKLEQQALNEFRDIYFNKIRPTMDRIRKAP